MMKDLGGMTITFDFKKLHKQADLIVCEGPLLSHYATETGDHYLLYWLDADEKCNRWMMLRTNLQTLRQYVNKGLPLLDVIKNPEDEFVWIIDFDDNMTPSQIQTIPVSKVPECYLPEKDALYEFENEDPLLQGNIDTYELNLPEKDSSFFKEFILKMGWHASSLRLTKKIAVF